MPGKIPLVVLRFRSLDANKIAGGSVNRKSRHPNLDDGNLLALYGYKKWFKGSVDVSDRLWMMSLLSAKMNIKNVDETVLEISTSSNIQENFQNTYRYIRDYWHSNYPVNVLFLGGDVIARKEFEFPDTGYFQMFNYAHVFKEHTSRAGDRKNVKHGSPIFNTYCNADVRFYSHRMSPEVWDVGNSWLESWQNYWEYEQDLYNAMMRSQKLSIQQMIIPSLAYQLPADEFQDTSKLKTWNGIDLNEANLIHLHSTRGSDKALKIAQDILPPPLSPNLYRAE